MSISSHEPGSGMDNSDSGLPADDVAEEMRHVGSSTHSYQFSIPDSLLKEKQRRFFEHYHADASPTGRTGSQPEMQDTRPRRVANYGIQGGAAVNINFEEMEKRIMTSIAHQAGAAKRIASILRYGSKARKVDAKRALGLNLPAASALQLLRFMKRHHRVTVEY